MGDEPELKASLFGQSVAAKGMSAIIIAVLCVFAGGVSFLLWDRVQTTENHLDVISSQHAKARESQTQQMTAEHTALIEGLKELKSVNQDTSAAIIEQNYIILSDDAEKKRIKSSLRMPESLKRKMNQ